MLKRKEELTQEQKDSIAAVQRIEEEAYETAKEEVDAALAYAPNNALFGSSSYRIPFPTGLWIYNALVGKKSRFAKWLFDTFAGTPVFIKMCIRDRTRAAVNTKSMIAGVEIKGSIGRFFVNSHGIEIPQEMVTVNTALISDADVAIALTDSTTEDTTAISPVNWKIALGQVDLARTRVRFSMPGDSMTVSGGILTAALRNGLIDLGQALYLSLIHI